MKPAVKKIMKTLHEAGVSFNVNKDEQLVEVRYTTSQDKLVTTTIPTLWFESEYLACFSMLEIPEIKEDIDPKYLKVLVSHLDKGPGK